MGRPELELARDTYNQRLDKHSGGWGQDPVFAARAGLINEAADQAVSRFAAKHTGSRFPAMWGPNYDWIPDQCHGAVNMIALQQMLVQNVGDRILLFPAWPTEWDVTFKVYAPHQTIIEGELRSGIITRLKVTPSSRYQDVETFVGKIPLPSAGSVISVTNHEWGR
ncbi:MAG: hypothetical protein PHO37_06715 [Kiritimatiellae bacterium]|nr:hypothetical protein [Kiritimatiellia bacterium]